MEDKEQYIQWFLQNNPTASRQQAELSYFTENNLKNQIRRGYANSDGTLNSYRVDRLRNIDVRTPFGMNVNGKYIGPSIEDYITNGVDGRPKSDVRVNTDIPGVEQELLGIDQMRTHMIGGGRYPNFKVVGEYEGKPNPFNAGYNIQNKKKIEEGTRQSRPEGNQRHVIVKDDNGRIFDLNLDLPHEGLGEPAGGNFPEHLANDPYYTPYKSENAYRRNRWRRLNDKNGNWIPSAAKFAETNQAAEDIKINSDGTVTHYNSMKYSIPEVEAARVRNAQPDNLFSPSHIFADGGRMKQQRSGASPETVDFFSRHGGTPMTTEELNRMREQYYAEQDEKARQEKEMRDFVIGKRNINFRKQYGDEEYLRNLKNPTDVEIDKLALDLFRDKSNKTWELYKKYLHGPLLSKVIKRESNMWIDHYEKRNAERERQNKRSADSLRKNWDDTPEEWKQPLNSKSFNPRTYDLTTDDLRLHERAAQQAQQSRSLDDDPHSLIRDNGEVKRRIGGTNNYDIYL